MRLRSPGKLLLSLALGLLLLIGLAMLALTLALDRLPRYQAQLKDWVHRQIGFHIAFTDVSPKLRWYGPELYLDHLELRSKDDQRVLARAAGGRVALDLWRLLRSGTLLAGRVELDQPRIVIARLGPDRFALASELVLRGSDTSPDAITLDDLPAGTLAIRGGVIIVQDWNPQLPRLTLRGVNLDLQRDRDRAALTVIARLPRELGEGIRMHGAADGIGSLRSLSWSAAVRATGLSIPGVSRLLPEYLKQLNAGTADVSVAARGRDGALQQADLQVQAQGVITQLTDEPPTRFDRIGGSLSLTHDGDRWTLLGRRLQTARAGQPDPDSQFEVSWQRGTAGDLELHGHASQLRAEALLPLAGLLPQADIRDRLRELEPSGEWLDTRIELARAATGQPLRLKVQAHFREVGFAPIGRAPGARGLSGTLSGTESSGRIDLDTRRAVLDWPRQFSQPVAVDELAGTLYWRRDAAGLLVSTAQLRAVNRDAVVHTQFAFTQPLDGSSPLLTLVAQVDHGQLAQAHNYLPRELLPPRTVEWLDRAFVAGQVDRAVAVIRGPLRHFPFRDGSGLFLVRFAVLGGKLDYGEGWPAIEDLDCHAEFRNEGLTVDLQRGRIGAVPLVSGQARFADFKTAQLLVRVTARGDAAQALGFLRATPVDAMADHAFSAVEAHGALEAQVDLDFPFHEFSKRRVLVHTRLAGVALNLVGSAVTATDLSGDATVDGAQVVRAEVRGRLLGGSVQMQARPPRRASSGRTQLDFRGTAAGEALRSAAGLPPAVMIEGETDWRAVLRMAPEPNRERSLRVLSTLTGLTLRLPEPLAKPAARALPAQADIRWPTGGGLQIRASLATVLRGALTFASEGGALRLKRAALALGGAEPVFDEAQLWNVGGTVEHLDLGGWLALAVPEKGGAPLSSYLRTAAVRVAQLDYLGLTFLDVGIVLTAAEQGLSIGVDGPNVSGTVTLPPNEDPSRPWTLEFSRLKFAAANPGDPSPESAPGAADAPAPDAAAAANPRAVPAIDFHAAEVTWGERHFGDVRATLRKVDDGITVPQISAHGPSFAASAQGEWRGKGAGVGRIEGAVTSTDVHETLRQFGFADVIEAKIGKMDFTFHWLGAPGADALAAAAGKVQITLDDGQILGLKPGAGRLLGLASLAELRRRLALDFSDLTDKGLAFDTVRGSFAVHDGSAYTDDLLVKGPAAEIGLIGRVGLKNRDYDQTAVVTGNVGSTLPLAAFAGGPVIGAAVLLFTQVFKQPLKGLARGYYRITGTWDNPVVERITSADAAAAEAPKGDGQHK